MRANEVRLYDLDAVNTTVVMRELPLNPDVQTVFMYDLDAVNTTVIMHYFGELSSGGTAWTLDLSDTVTLSDEVVKAVGTSYADSITLSDATLKLVRLAKGDTVILSDAPGRAYGVSKSDSVTLSDLRRGLFGKFTSDVVILSDEEIGGIAPGVFFPEIRGEDKMSRAVREFLHETTLTIRDDAAFFYARQSDFNSIKNKPEGIKVVLAPLDHSDISPDDSPSTHSYYRCVLMIVQFDDVQGSEEETEKILDETDKFLRQLQAKLKRKSMNEEVEQGLTLSTDTTDISDENISALIKITVDCLTGWEYEFKLAVPDQFDYCSIYG